VCMSHDSKAHAGDSRPPLPTTRLFLLGCLSLTEVYECARLSGGITLISRNSLNRNRLCDG
jgi:hypothetical protein